MSLESAKFIASLVLVAVAIAPQSRAQSAHDLDAILRLAKSETLDRGIIDQAHAVKKAESGVLLSGVLPVVNLDVSARRAGQSTTSLLQNQRSEQQAATDTDQSSNGQMDFPDQVYGNLYNWNLTFQTPLVGFGRLGAVTALSGMRDDYAEIERDASVQAYYFNVIKAYNEALLQLNHYEAAKRSERHAEALLKFAKVEHQTGARSQIDLLRSESFYALARAEFHQSSIESEAALSRLRNILGIPRDQAFALAGGTEVTNRFLTQTVTESGKNLEVAMKEQERKMAERFADYQAARYWPTLYLAAGASSEARDFGSGFSSEKANDPGDLLRNETLSYNVGLVLSWTLFDGFARSEEAKKAAAEAMIAKFQLEKLQREQSVMENETKERLRVSGLVYEASEAAVKAAKLALEKVDSDFKAGAASLTDFLEVQKDLYEAEKQLYEALAGRIISAATYRMTFGIDLLGGGNG